MAFSTQLADKLNRLLSPDSNPTTPTAELGADDPNVDTKGAGESPVTPPDYAAPGVPPESSAPMPIVSTAPAYIPPGAPRSQLTGPPPQNLGVATYSVGPTFGSDPVRIVPGSATPRRVIITVVSSSAPMGAPGCYVAPDSRQDTTGAMLAVGMPYVLVTGSPLYAVPDTSDTFVSVLIEPSQ